jgi:hypothetical protein
MRDIRTSFVSAAVAALALSSTSALAQPTDGELKVVHGITGDDLGGTRDFPVDVEVVGVGCILPNFTFGTISQSFTLPAGSYDIKVRLADGACGGQVAIDAPGVPLAAGESATVIAHLTANNQATATKFTNDLSPSPGAKDGRFVAHHTAAAPAVDIDVFRFRQGGASFNGVTNGQSGATELRSGGAFLLVSPAGGHPISFRFIRQPAQSTLLAYAVGNVQNGTFQFIVDIIEQEQPETFQLTVVHGITGQDLNLSPDLPVDVFVSNVGCVLTDLRFGDIEGEFELPAGTYDIEVSLSDGNCGGAVAVSATGVPFAEGENATVIAHLDASGAATASKFVNDLSRAGFFRGRAVAHHTAAAPAVDIRVSRFGRNQLELLGVTNGLSGGGDLFLGRYGVSIAPAGGHPIFHDRLRVRPNQTALVYAVGSVSSGTFQLLVDRKRQTH